MVQDEILTIAGKTVDIIPNSITRTLQINDLGSAKDRQSNYSNTIELPMTANNKAVFEFLGVAGSNSRSQYSNLPCTYTVMGIPLIVNGVANIKSTSQYYEVTIIDGLIDLTQRLKNKKLSDLNYSDMNHFLNPTVYTDSFSNDSGYIYGLGDFGLTGGIKVERQVPSVFVHTIWDKIFSQAGVDYSGEIFQSNEDFKTEVITPAKGYEVQDVQPTENSIGSFQTNNISKFDSYKASDGDDFILQNITEQFAFNTTLSDNRLTFENGRIKINNDLRLKVSVSLNYQCQSINDTFRVGLNGNSYTYTEYLDPNQTTLNLDLTLDLEQGDEIYFLMAGVAVLIDEFGGDSFYRIDFSGQADISLATLSGGFYIDFSKIMGDMSQLDFIKDILYRYGLIFKPVNNNNGYEFLLYETLLNNRTSAIDWTDKMVAIDSENYESDYGRVNKAKYEYHEDIVVPSHDGEFTVDVENIDAEKDLFSSHFEIPTNYTTYSNRTLYYHPVWEEKEDDGQTIVKVKDAPYKLFRIQRYSGTLNASFFTDANGVSFSGDVPYLTLENISLQYFLNVYYKGFRNMVNTYKEVEMELNLSEWDIYNLDFFKLVYFEQTGKYYYINKIKHTSRSTISDATLIEINEFSENLPVDRLGSYTYTISYNTQLDVDISRLTTDSTPTYNDPENDEPLKIKFLTGNGTDIKLYQDNSEITAGQEIAVSDWNVRVEDMANTNTAHTYTWDYQVADAGSGEYGSEVGQLTVDVRENINTAPIADAGSDSQHYVEEFGDGVVYIPLDGSNSFDSTGTIATYTWDIISQPSNNESAIQNNNTSDSSALLIIGNDKFNAGVYTIRLTVADSQGLTDTDTVNINVSVFGGEFA